MARAWHRYRIQWLAEVANSTAGYSQLLILFLSISLAHQRSLIIRHFWTAVRGIWFCDSVLRKSPYCFFSCNCQIFINMWAEEPADSKENFSILPQGILKLFSFYVLFVNCKLPSYVFVSAVDLNLLISWIDPDNNSRHA